MKFKALRAFADSDKVSTRIVELSEDDLTPGNVVIQVKYSSVNYKDALAGSPGGKIILKKFPINPGIDAAGIVVTSADKRFQPGHEVLITGCNTGEINDGGYSEILRADADNVVAKPQGLSLRECMILGTAGFTAALALYRMEQNQQKPNLGPIVVTGASGGVGVFATELFAKNNYEVIAVSGKPELWKNLKKLGASRVVSFADLNLGHKPLEAAQFGGAVDSVGGKTLAALMAHTCIYGNIACIGLAESATLNTTVMPLILRGVSLLGISSNNCPRQLRDLIWKNLAGTWRLKNLEAAVTKTIGLEQLPEAFADLLERRSHGRILVQL